MEFTAKNRITIITGHYGSGKTSIAVNMAKHLADGEKKIRLVDLDIVNPYFRSADFHDELTAKGVQLIAPEFALTNLDIPALTAGIDAAISDQNSTVILDVGGDDTGAVALGRYAPMLHSAGYDLYYVVNAYRFLTSTPGEALALLHDIEGASRLVATGLINNSNLGAQTTAQDIKKTDSYMEELSKLSGLPVVLTSADARLKGNLPELTGTVFWMNSFTLPEWAKNG